MQVSRKYLDPRVLSKLSTLDLKARLVVEGFLSGLHTSPYRGFSQEFADHRQYMPGDELKRVDWKVFGRSDRYYIKEYQEETNLRAYLLLDKSGSMSLGEEPSKLEYAKYLCAGLAYILDRQKDSVGIITFDDAIRKYVPPSSKKINFSRILTAIDETPSNGETALAGVLYEMARRIKRRGLVIIISDLLDDQTAIVRAIKSFRTRKHELLVFQVLDRQERDFDYPEAAVFFDLETGREMTVDPGTIKHSYRERVAAMLENFRLRMLESRVDYEILYTDTPYDRALYAFLRKRSRLA